MQPCCMWRTLRQKDLQCYIFDGNDYCPAFLSKSDSRMKLRKGAISSNALNGQS